MTTSPTPDPNHVANGCAVMILITLAALAGLGAATLIMWVIR